LLFLFSVHCFSFSPPFIEPNLERDSYSYLSRIVILYRENWLRVWVEWKQQKSCHCWTVGGVYPHVKGDLRVRETKLNLMGSMDRQYGLEFGSSAAIDIFLCKGSPLLPKEEDDE
jgi:hypothetical protein